MTLIKKEYLVSFNTIIIKEIQRFTRIWVQTLLPSVITTVLYFLIFGQLMGQRIGDMSGISYIEYIVPGLVMMAVINNSYANVVSSFFGSKFQRSIEELLVSPTPNLLILLGFVLGGALRGLLVGIIVTGISLFFTKITIMHVGLTILIVVLTAILFATAGLVNAIYAKKFDDISVIPTFILSPLTYLGGVFYSINLLPEFWYNVSLLNPILYMVNAFRYSLLGISDVSIYASMTIIISFTVVLFLAAWYLLGRSVGLRK
jgi:ABC-2 type transport system permease protein